MLHTHIMHTRMHTQSHAHTHPHVLMVATFHICLGKKTTVSGIFSLRKNSGFQALFSHSVCMSYNVKGSW